VLSTNGAAEGAGDVEGVAGLAAGAGGDLRDVNAAASRDGDEGGGAFGEGGGFATDDEAAVLGEAGGHADVEVADPGDGGLGI